MKNFTHSTNVFGARIITVDTISPVITVDTVSP